MTDTPASATPAPSERNALERFVRRVFDLEPGEAAPVLAGLLLFFLLFAGYFMLRPVRETMGVTGGVDQLQWLFTATFVFTLAAMPLFGWVAGRVARRRVLPWTFAFCAVVLAVFGALFLMRPDSVWIARGFYVWLSVFNLIAVSVAWSVLADVFPYAHAKRLFALIAAGASVGGLVGPVLGVLLVGGNGHAGLVLLSAAMLPAAIAAAQRLQAWRDRHPLPASDRDAAARARPLGGSPFAGATTVLRSPFLLGVAAFVLLLASTTTFLYFEQARLVAETYPDRVEQTRVFGLIDIVVQSLTILLQVFVTGRVARRLGVVVLLTAVPLLIAAGFVWLSVSPVFAVLAVVMVARRTGEYALVRPGREMLFTLVAPEARYKAKNFIDSVVYRGADALSGWFKTLVDLVLVQPALAALMGAAIALAWTLTGATLARARPEAKLG